MMRPIIMQVALFRNDADFVRSEVAMLHLLHALVAIDRLWIRFHPQTPAIYTSGVRYVYKDSVESAAWQDIPTCLAKGYGDCKDFAAWRVAELLEQGIAARPIIQWRKIDGAWKFHALMEYPNGTIEDPSKKLGMGSHDPFTFQVTPEQVPPTVGGMQMAMTAKDIARRVWNLARSGNAAQVKAAKALRDALLRRKDHPKARESLAILNTAAAKLRTQQQEEALQPEEQNDNEDVPDVDDDVSGLDSPRPLRFPKEALIKLVQQTNADDRTAKVKAIEAINKIERQAAAGDEASIKALRLIRNAQATISEGGVTMHTTRRVIDALTGDNGGHSLRGYLSPQAEMEIAFDFFSKIKDTVKSISPQLAAAVQSIAAAVPVAGPFLAPLAGDAVKSATGLLDKAKKGDKQAVAAIQNVKKEAAKGDEKAQQALDTLKRVNEAQKVVEKVQRDIVTDAYGRNNPSRSKWTFKNIYRIGYGNVSNAVH